MSISPVLDLWEDYGSFFPILSIAVRSHNLLLSRLKSPFPSFRSLIHYVLRHLNHFSGLSLYLFKSDFLYSSIPGGAYLVSSRWVNHFSLPTGYTLAHATHYKVSFYCCSCALLNQLVFHQVVCQVASIFAWYDLVQVAGFCISLLSLMRFLSALSSVLSKSVCKPCQDVFNPIFQIQDAVDII